MNRALLCTVLAFSLEAGAAPAQPSAERPFQKCMGCHQPPDLKFTTDRAFLDQIHRTA